MRVGGLQSLVALVEMSRGDPERARTLRRAGDRDPRRRRRGRLRQLRPPDAGVPRALARQRHGDERAARYLPGRSPRRLEAARVRRRPDRGPGRGRQSNERRISPPSSPRGGRSPTGRRSSATAARCRALVLGARGDLDGAIAAAEAVATSTALRLPFEHARSLLVLGEVQRRAKARRAARETLTAAMEASSASARTCGSRRPRPSERESAAGRRSRACPRPSSGSRRLVAEGQSNKEVAAELFVSVRAVESNLSKVYAKLGIESRTELARRI